MAVNVTLIPLTTAPAHCAPAHCALVQPPLRAMRPLRTAPAHCALVQPRSTHCAPVQPSTPHSALRVGGLGRSSLVRLPALVGGLGRSSLSLALSFVSLPCTAAFVCGAKDDDAAPGPCSPLMAARRAHGGTRGGRRREGRKGGVECVQRPRSRHVAFGAARSTTHGHMTTLRSIELALSRLTARCQPPRFPRAALHVPSSNAHIRLSLKCGARSRRRSCRRSLRAPRSMRAT
jgi:hypothetical protein